MKAPRPNAGSFRRKKGKICGGVARTKAEDLTKFRKKPIIHSSFTTKLNNDPGILFDTHIYRFVDPARVSSFFYFGKRVSNAPPKRSSVAAREGHHEVRSGGPAGARAFRAELRVEPDGRYGRCMSNRSNNVE